MLPTNPRRWPLGQSDYVRDVFFPYVVIVVRTCVYVYVMVESVWFVKLLFMLFINFLLKMTSKNELLKLYSGRHLIIEGEQQVKPSTWHHICICWPKISPKLYTVQNGRTNHRKTTILNPCNGGQGDSIWFLMEVYTVHSIVKHMVQKEYKLQLSSEPFHIVEDDGLA